MVDALIAVALLAAAGTLATGISLSTLRSFDRVMERSSALTNLDTLARMLRAAGLKSADALLPVADDRFSFRYEVVRNREHLGRLVPVILSAAPKSSGAPPITLELLLVDR